MDPDDLRRTFHAATDTLEPRPGFTESVLLGAKRRRTRRRTVIATGALAVIALGAGTVTALDDSMTEPAGDAATYDFSILDKPTRGDLAGDRDYLDQAIAAYTRGREVSPNQPRTGIRYTGTPKVVWAGLTPAGRAAIVGQSGATTDRTINVDGSRSAPLGPAFGLVTGDQPTLVNEVPLFSGGPPTFLFGAQDLVLISLNPTAEFVSGWTVGPDGKGRRDWQNLNPDANDGAILARLPDGTDPRTVRVTDTKGLAAGKGRPVFASSAYADGADRQSKPIPSRGVDWRQLPTRIAGARGAALTEIHDMMAGKGYADALEMAQVTGFQGIIDLPDGRTLIGLEYVPDFTGSRFYAVYTDGRGNVQSITYGGRIDIKAALAAKVRLTEGWLVADYGSALRYRTAPDAAWQDAGHSMALLPSTATEVEVERDGQAPRIATL